MGEVFEVNVKGKRGKYLEAALPLTPCEMLDLLDRGGLSPGDTPVCEVTGGKVSRDTYAIVSSDWRNLYELNALAWRLASMDDIQRVAFDGLLRMETDKADGTLPLGKLVDLAYGVDCCHVVPGISNDNQLDDCYNLLSRLRLKCFTKK